MKIEVITDLYGFTGKITKIIRDIEALKKQDDETIRAELPELIEKLRNLEIEILMMIVRNTNPQILN